MRKLVSRLQVTSRAFARSKRGNVAITFALAAIPLLGFIGAAIDYSAASAAKVDLQSALDSTALMLAREAASDSSSQLQTHASQYFTAVFQKPQASNVAITATYTSSGGSQVTVAGSASIATAFMSILGFPSLNISGSSTTKWGMSRLRVALVLDNTGSMAQYGKLSALKTATQNLLSQLQAAVTTNGDVYVSIIPFVKDVDLGAGNYAASWIDWTDWNSNNGTCSSGWGWGGATKSTCSGTWTPANHNTWNGCVTDRGTSSAPSSGNYDTNVVAPSTAIVATLYAAEQYSSCPQAAMGLSYNWSAMNTLVNNMAANGNTNQAIGLQLGWMSLVGGGPFTAPAQDPNYTYSQIIILLTDGLNTQDRWYSDQGSIDARQQMTCNNIKAAGITLYTIQVNTDGDPTSTLLQNCASSTSDFFLLTSANQIVTTFNTIGTNLSKLYVAK